MKVSNKITSVALIALTVTNVFASEKTDKDFDRLLTTYDVNPKDEQSYCYTDEDGSVQGINVNTQVRLASVSKLVTSLWAMEEKGPNFRYETKLYVKGNNLHIQGSFDPFMGNQKMMFLVSQLNTLGYKHFDKITFDKTVQIYRNAQIHTDPYPLVTRETNAYNINLYFNTGTWTDAFKAEYKRLAALAKKGLFEKEVTFSVDQVEFSETNPLVEDLNVIPEDVRVLTLKSPPLYKYLKETNVASNNYSSHTIFLGLGGVEKFEKYIRERFDYTPDQIKLWNGNGLPTTIDGVRHDNYATCAIMVDIINELKASAEGQGKEIEDIVAVPGSDAGTFRNRLNSSDLKNTFVAKTGTLMHTSTLAGALKTAKGFSFFGIFNQTTDIVGAKKVQNDMVRSLFAEMGGPKNFNYSLDGFNTYDNNERIKNFDIVENEVATDFSSIESGLTE